MKHWPLLVFLILLATPLFAIEDTFLAPTEEVVIKSKWAEFVKNNKKLMIYLIGSAPFLVGLLLTTGRNTKKSKKRPKLTARQKHIKSRQQKEVTPSGESRTFQYLRFLNGQNVIVFNSKGKIEYATASAFALFDVYDRQRKVLQEKFYKVKEGLDIDATNGIQLVEVEGERYVLNRQIYKYNNENFTIYSLNRHYEAEDRPFKTGDPVLAEEIEKLNFEGKKVIDLEALVHQVLTKMSFVFQLTGTMVDVEPSVEPVQTSQYEASYLETALSQMLYGINKMLGDSRKSKKLTIKLEQSDSKVTFKFFIHNFRIDKGFLTKALVSDYGESNFATYLGNVEKSLSRYRGRINVSVLNSNENKLLGSQISIGLRPTALREVEKTS